MRGVGGCGRREEGVGQWWDGRGAGAVDALLGMMCRSIL